MFRFSLMFLEENHTDSLRGPLGNVQGQTGICGSDRNGQTLQHLSASSALRGALVQESGHT